MPHPEPRRKVRFRTPSVGGPVHVAVLGGIGLHKGYLTLLDVARYADEHDLPLRFVVFGETSNHGAFRRLSNIDVTGVYAHDALPSLVRGTECTVAAFFSVWPETFSYTLSEAIALGLYPVSFDLGAPSERIRAFGHGSLVPKEASPKAICEALIAAGHAPRSAEELDAPCTEYEDLLRDYYALPD
jgi:glycosyltransferase involved in cell wall biosynthesis